MTQIDQSMVLTPSQDLESYENTIKTVTLEDIRRILEITVKHDVENKLICFLAMILNFTSEDQVNIGFNSESSTGKSYIPLELAKYFPEEDVKIQGYTSPTAFFHEEGTWDEDERIKTIDLHQKILIFLDMPHDLLLQRLRPLLSHDKKKIMHKITDRTKSKGLATKNVEVIGYPTVIFCTTKFSLDDQERTRLLLLSPEIDESKIKDSLFLIADKLSNRIIYDRNLGEDEERKWLRNRVQMIKLAKISEIVLDEETKELITKRFLEDHQFLIPRHQRDFPRLIGLIKANTLLNFLQREKSEVNGSRVIMANNEDVEAGYNLYSKISRPNELGIPPEIMSFYERIVKPELKETLTKKDLMSRYYSVYHRTIGKKKLELVLESLLETGLIVEEKDPNDKRVTIYSKVGTQ